MPPVQLRPAGQRAVLPQVRAFTSGDPARVEGSPARPDGIPQECPDVLGLREILQGGGRVLVLSVLREEILKGENSRKKCVGKQ